MSGWSGEFRAEVEGFEVNTPWSYGGAGLVDAVLDMMAHVEGTRRWDRDELLSLTSVGFKHYVYEPSYNPAYEPPRWVSSKGRLFSNYGIVESMGQHTGWEVMELNFIGAGDLAKLLAYEFAASRVVLTWAPVEEGGEPGWHVLVSLDASPARFIVGMMGVDGVVHEVDVTARGGSVQGSEEEDLVNWCVVARPGEQAPWTLSLEKRRELVCRWGIKHARTSKEFFHETRENYAVGLSGYASLARVLSSGEEFSAEVVRRHVEELYQGRRALSRRLGAWGSEAAWKDAAACYGEVSALLEGLCEEAGGAFGGEYGERLAVVASVEERAVDRLSEVIDAMRK